MKLVYSREAKEAIRHLPPLAKRGIQQALESLPLNPYQGKALQKELMEYWSIPFKRYRVIYKIFEEERMLMVYSIALRENVYEEFVKYLARFSKKL